jgi:replicative DNA helicase
MDIRTEAGSNFATSISKTVAQLADIAKEFKVAIVFLSQLSNDAEGKQATVMHLKDSGGIGEGVDCIIILNNQDRINKNKSVKSNEVWLSIEQRSGSSGQIKCIVDLGKSIYVEKKGQRFPQAERKIIKQEELPLSS